MSFRSQYEQWQQSQDASAGTFGQKILKLGLEIVNKLICFYGLYLCLITVLKLIQISVCSTTLNAVISFFDLLVIIPQVLLFIIAPNVITWILLVCSIAPSIFDVVYYVGE